MSTVSCDSKIVEKVSNAFNFTVDKFPMFGPDNMRTPHYGLFRSDNQECIGKAVTSRYVAHQTEDIIALVDAAASAFEGVGDVDCYFRDGHYVSIQPTKDERRAIFGTKDNIFPRIVIRAGYDGKAFNAAMGYYRDACRNLAIMREVTGTTVSIRHTSGLRSKMDELIGSFQNLRQSWSILANYAEQLQNRNVSLMDFLQEIYGETPVEQGRAATVYQNRQNAIVRRIQEERSETGRSNVNLLENPQVSLWEAFNGVQGFVQWEATRKSSVRGSAVSGFGRIIAAANDAAVHRAERVANAMLVA